MRETINNKSDEEKAISKQKELDTKNNKSPEEKAISKQKRLDTNNNKSPEAKAAKKTPTRADEAATRPSPSPQPSASTSINATNARPITNATRSIMISYTPS